jgi:hypothetical protein
MDTIRANDNTVRFEGRRPLMDHLLGLLKAVARGDLNRPRFKTKPDPAITLVCNTEKQADRYEDIGMYVDRVRRDTRH